MMIQITQKYVFTRTDLVGSQVRFDEQGDGLGRYNIYNYQKAVPPGNQIDSSSTELPGLTNLMDNGSVPSPSFITMRRGGAAGAHYSRLHQMLQQHHQSSGSGHPISGTYAYAKVGFWFKEDGLTLDKSSITFNERSRTTPESVCSHACKLGYIKILQQGDHCCWICNACKDQEYVVDEYTCEKCDDGWWPVDNRTGCRKLPENYMKWDSVYAIVPVVTSVIGIILTSFVIRTLMKHLETPIVKASGRELSFILLGGIMFCFLLTFILLAKPSIFTCSLQRFGVGTGFSVIYSALLTKTNRISRIFDSARKSAKRPSFISPKSQAMICMCLVSVQVSITGSSFLLFSERTASYMNLEYLKQ